LKNRVFYFQSFKYLPFLFTKNNIMLLIHDRIEKARLNGYRKPGDLYLIGRLVNFQCCKLPLELNKNLLPRKGLLPLPEEVQYPLPFAERLANNPEPDCNTKACSIFLGKNQFAGMIWISEIDYSHAAMWISEARTEGIQIQIPGNVYLHGAIEIGKSWIMLAHRKAIVDYSEGAGGWVNDETGLAETAIKYRPGFFTMFQVQGMEYVMKMPWDMQHGNRNPGSIFGMMAKDGVTLVNVIHDEDLAKEDLREEKTQGYE
jgi:hypothetical protein